MNMKWNNLFNKRLWHRLCLHAGSTKDRADPGRELCRRTSESALQKVLSPLVEGGAAVVEGASEMIKKNDEEKHCF